MVANNIYDNWFNWFGIWFNQRIVPVIKLGYNWSCIDYVTALQIKKGTLKVGVFIIIQDSNKLKKI